MENYELYIPNPPKKINGRFHKGDVPFNKGVRMCEWMDGRKIRKVLKNLEIGRKLGNSSLPGANKIPVVGIKDGKLYAFDSSTNAANILKAKGIMVNSRNIRACILGKPYKYNGYYYTRKRAGGYQWFAADDIEKYKNLINQ